MPGTITKQHRHCEECGRPTVHDEITEKTLECMACGNRIRVATDGGAEYENDSPHITRLNRESFDGGFHVDGKFSNGWRFEMKSLDGQTYYNLHVPLDELDRWENGAQIDDWSFIPTEEVLEDLRASLENIDHLGELKDEADTIPVMEYGSVFESLERESHV